MSNHSAVAQVPHSGQSPLIAFIGAGWIGGARLTALHKAKCAQIQSILEPSSVAAEQLAPELRETLVGSFEELLARRPDGVVISTPSALHARQAITALEAGVAVFCQKPLGRNGAEVRDVLQAAQVHDRLLAVDFCYRTLTAAQQLQRLITDGEIGDIFAVELVFHNAYGPDKPWYYNRAESGGGCLLDLGLHLVDLALWVLGFPQATQIEGRLFSQGSLLSGDAQTVEDYASCSFLADGTEVNLRCSWNLPAGCDAVIKANFIGTKGALVLENCNGSFYDFQLCRNDKQHSFTLVSPPDEWGGRAICNWALALSSGSGFDPAALEYLASAQVIDAAHASHFGRATKQAPVPQRPPFQQETPAAQQIELPGGTHPTQVQHA